MSKFKDTIKEQIKKDADAWDAAVEAQAQAKVQALIDEGHASMTPPKDFEDYYKQDPDDSLEVAPEHSWLSDRWFYTRYWISDRWFDFGVWLSKGRRLYYMIAIIMAVALLVVFG